MTNKVYRTAGGKTVDMGSLLLQNEEVRAVGNMRVNARGDALDSNNRIIDQKNRQITRQTQRQTNVNTVPVHSSNLSAQKASQAEPIVPARSAETPNADPALVESTAAASEPMAGMELKGGLAAAIAAAEKSIKNQ
jgi:hypothetical protein